MNMRMTSVLVSTLPKVLLVAIAGCGFGDGEPTMGRKAASYGTENASHGATPRPTVQFPEPEGTANLSDIEPLPKAKGRRHVIVMIGDGMQLAHEVAASRYLYGTDYGLSFHSLPTRTFKTTWDVTSYDQRAANLGASGYSPDNYDPTIGYDPLIGGDKPYPLLEDNLTRRAYFVGQPYPDSAATATAMSTGTKTHSAAIGVGPNYNGTNALEHASSLLRRFYGMSIGFVTTVQFYHATPAGFFAHNSNRNAYAEIANELLTRVTPDVMIGAGFGMNEFRAQDLTDLRNTGKYTFVARESGQDGSTAILAAAERAVQDKKGLFGLFGDAAMGNLVSSVPLDSPGVPTIQRPANEDPTLANAAVAALRVLSQDPDGFFLMIEQGDIDRANHEQNFSRMIGSVADLDTAVRAVTDYIDRPGDALDFSNTTLIVTADHANSYMRLVTPLGAGDLPMQNGSSYPDGEITYGGGSHTAELVTVYMKGVAESKVEDYMTPYPGLSIIDDTSIYRLILDGARR